MITATSFDFGELADLFAFLAILLLNIHAFSGPRFKERVREAAVSLWIFFEELTTRGFFAETYTFYLRLLNILSLRHTSLVTHAKRCLFIILVLNSIPLLIFSIRTSLYYFDTPIDFDIHSDARPFYYNLFKDFEQKLSPGQDCLQVCQTASALEISMGLISRKGGFVYDPISFFDVYVASIMNTVEAYFVVSLIATPSFMFSIFITGKVLQLAVNTRSPLGYIMSNCTDVIISLLFPLIMLTLVSLFSILLLPSAIAPVWTNFGGWEDDPLAPAVYAETLFQTVQLIYWADLLSSVQSHIDALLLNSWAQHIVWIFGTGELILAIASIFLIADGFLFSIPPRQSFVNITYLLCVAPAMIHTITLLILIASKSIQMVVGYPLKWLFMWIGNHKNEEAIMQIWRLLLPVTGILLGIQLFAE